MPNRSIKLVLVATLPAARSAVLDKRHVTGAVAGAASPELTRAEALVSALEAVGAPS